MAEGANGWNSVAKGQGGRNPRAPEGLRGDGSNIFISVVVVVVAQKALTEVSIIGRHRRGELL